MPLVNKTVDTSMGNIKLPERQIEFGKKQLAKQLEQSGGIKRLLPRKLGNPSTGELFVPETDNSRVWFTTYGDEAPDIGSMPKIGIPKEMLVRGQFVLIQKMPSGDYRYDSADAGVAGTVFNEGDTDAPNQTPITQSQLSWGTLQPDTGLIATVKGAIYGDNAVKDLNTANFASSPLDTTSNPINIPSTANRAIGVLVQLDPATRTLSYKQSAEFSSSTNLAEAYYQNKLPLRDSGKWRIGYLRLANGITQFDYASVWTCPEWFPIPEVVEFGLDADFGTAQTLANGDTLDIRGDASTIETELIAAGVYEIRAIDTQYTQTTTDATPTVLASSPVIAQLSGRFVEVEVKGFRSDFSAGVGGKSFGVFRRASGGNVTLVGTLSEIVKSDGAATFTLSANTTAQTVELVVTGIAAQTWNWTARMKIL